MRSVTKITGVGYCPVDTNGTTSIFTLFVTIFNFKKIYDYDLIVFLCRFIVFSGDLISKFIDDDTSIIILNYIDINTVICRNLIDSLN